MIVSWLRNCFFALAITHATAADDLREFSILVVGDTGFNASLAPVSADSGLKLGERIGFAEATDGVRSLINGDLNFANMETVVTDRNDLDPVAKAFNFRMHPNGVRHLLARGFNIFSTANNHSMDYGVRGAEETRRNLDALTGEGLLASPGLGSGRRAAATASLIAWEEGRFRRFDLVRDIAPALIPAAMGLEFGVPIARRTPALTVAISAIGIGGQSFPPDETRTGQLSFPDGSDYVETLDRLRATAADFRVLSIHYGQEFRTQTDANTIQRFRRQAILSGAANMLVGHHHHVVNGIEIANGRPIFYGLGNFIHFGTRDLSGNGVCRDYGLMARSHFSVDGQRRVTLQAIEAIALQGTHRRVRPWIGEEGRRRIAVLNVLAAQFDAPSEGARGVRFFARADGSGLYCAPGAETLGGRIGALCNGYSGPTYPSEAQQAQIRSDCGPRVAEANIDWEE